MMYKAHITVKLDSTTSFIKLEQANIHYVYYCIYMYIHV